MSYRDHWRSMSFRRRAAIALAGLWLVVFATLFLPKALGISPLLWLPTMVIVVLALSALSEAVVLVEIFRATRPAPTLWADGRHFQVVWSVAAVLLIVQGLGVAVMMGAYGSAAL
jgi:hypothetical protein